MKVSGSPCWEKGLGDEGKLGQAGVSLTFT